MGDRSAHHTPSVRPSYQQPSRQSSFLPLQRKSKRLEAKVQGEERCDGVFKIRAKLESNHDVMCLRFAPEGDILAAGYANGTIKIFSVKARELVIVSTLAVLDQSLPVTCIRFFPDVEFAGDMLMATYASGVVICWSIRENNAMVTIDEMRKSKTTMAAAFNNTGDHLATVGNDNQIHIYDMKSTRRIFTLEAGEDKFNQSGHKARVFAIQYDPTSLTNFITGGWDDTLQFWDSRTKRAVRQIFGPHICGDALDLDMSQSQILTGSWRRDKALQIWDYGSGNLVHTLPTEEKVVCHLYCAQWIGKDFILAGGCSGNLARLITRNNLSGTSGLYSELSNGVYCVDNNRNGPTPIVAVGAKGKITLLNIVLPSSSYKQ